MIGGGGGLPVEVLLQYEQLVHCICLLKLEVVCRSIDVYVCHILSPHQMTNVASTESLKYWNQNGNR